MIVAASQYTNATKCVCASALNIQFSTFILLLSAVLLKFRMERQGLFYTSLVLISDFDLLSQRREPLSLYLFLLHYCIAYNQGKEKKRDKKVNVWRVNEFDDVSILQDCSTCVSWDICVTIAPSMPHCIHVTPNSCQLWMHNNAVLWMNTHFKVLNRCFFSSLNRFERWTNERFENLFLTLYCYRCGSASDQITSSSSLCSFLTWQSLAI